MRSAFFATLFGTLAVPAAAPPHADFGFRDPDRPRAIKRWIPGHYSVVSRAGWVPGCRERVWRPARYGWRHGPRGVSVRCLVRAPGFVIIFTPGHYETVRTRVWVPGHHE